MMRVLFLNGPLKGDVEAIDPIKLLGGPYTIDVSTDSDRKRMTYFIDEFMYEDHKIMVGWVRGTHKLAEDGSKIPLSVEEIFDIYKRSGQFDTDQIKFVRINISDDH